MSSSHGGRKSWIEEANALDCHFPLENLPFCVFRRAQGEGLRVGVGIGVYVVDLLAAEGMGLVDGRGLLERCAHDGGLNALFAEGTVDASRLRDSLLSLLESGSPDQASMMKCLHRMSEVMLEVPFVIGNYTDFLASYNHALNVGRLYRPDNPVLPNFKSMPIAYHGRASSVVVSGERVFRPRGLFRPSHDSVDLAFGLSRKLDFELELGVFIGKGNSRGVPIDVQDAERHIAGLCLVNDWSARDIQAWETQPLGPFLGKNFCTSISPWVVTLDALKPYRVAMFRDMSNEAEYLQVSGPASETFEIFAEVRLRTPAMKAAGIEPELISRSVFSRDSYWNIPQMVAHHTVNGCNLRTGDLLATGTISGPSQGSQGSLLELAQGGRCPIRLQTGEHRSFLEDGDEVHLTAYCQIGSGPRIGFGECIGEVGTTSR